ncbi:MAG TPA: DegT/DnrJ/EryC1/StrS family aminotransferase [Ignavibacteria bacterium]|nr:DegT/DnrJ/EryC1/StrS family aminotransferase [Ignavibacteria bacterium]HQY53308.1 DegT/DnrJ/EryC1/StrS family aminotransferase [Ignavibacteria bacterium]HRB01409.1 DegT/DnrJ/EryC1/StrS family aminotransferase [Ignavibacteria bacterium]
MKVPLLDLKAQYRTIKEDIDKALISVAESQGCILGPEVEKLEKDLAAYLDCKYAIGVSSGTDALLVALMAIDIKPGDEVIIPTYSFFATAGVVSRLNATPVFIDSDPVTFNIDPTKLEALINEKTKAIVPVHLYGQCADMDPIMEIANKHGLMVIEDGAQAIGSQYKDGRKAGSIGQIGCFSFYPSKNLGCFGDGGLVTTNDETLYERLKIMRVHGGKPKYYHKVIGGNFRLDAIQAAVLNVKFPHLDSWTAKRQENAELYTKFFKDHGLAEVEGKLEFDERNKVLLPEPVYKKNDLKYYHIYNQYVIRVENRDELRKYMTENEIGSEIYYPVPFHLQECFADLGYEKGDFPVSESCAADTIALPIYPELTNEQIEFTVKTIGDFIKK